MFGMECGLQCRLLIGLLIIIGVSMAFYSVGLSLSR